MSTIR